MLVVRVVYLLKLQRAFKLLILRVLNHFGLGSNKKSRKGIPMNLSGPKLRERARKAALTRQKNKLLLLQNQTQESITGELKKVVIYLDEDILKKFRKSMPAGFDRTLTGGIRHAMQDYIHKHRR